MDNVSIITTSDGSHSLLNTALNETYHSTHGALQESVHVFIHNGLDVVIQRGQRDEIKILEIGFGTGLNVLLTRQRGALTKRKIKYTALEAFPIDIALARQLNYPLSLRMPDAEEFLQLHRLPWGENSEVSPDFHLMKLNVTLQEATLVNQMFDLVYYDAFAPAKQPEMWELAVLRKVAEALTPQGIFVTYCARGQLKRDLKSLGFFVETLPGPPGKKEMVRAVKTAS
jgi:tRNA U34 5-methylaminomethyl-2-thiouridine-forming methyltransferase MnmC